MLSKAQIHMSKLLKKISKSYNVELIEELVEGNKRYDFYFTSFPPIVIEVDGMNHHFSKADGFFFKTTEQLLKYKKNDAERELFNTLGKIKLIRFSDQDFPSLSELLDIFEQTGILEILEKGNDEDNANYQRIKYAEEQNRRRREQNKEFRKKLKR